MVTSVIDTTITTDNFDFSLPLRLSLLLSPKPDALHSSPRHLLGILTKRGLQDVRLSGFRSRALGSGLWGLLFGRGLGVKGLGLRVHGLKGVQRWGSGLKFVQGLKL